MARLPETRDAPAADTLSPTGPYRAFKQAGLLLLCVTWVALGIFGHEPWRTEDAVTFGVAWDMMRGGSITVPMLAGEPYLVQPPLVYVLAASSARAFGGMLAPHDAARVAVALLLATTMLALTAAGIELNGRRTRWLPVLLFIGCVGLWDRGHQLSSELGLMAGIAGAAWGLALAQRRCVAGGAVTGVATGLAFLADGLSGPLWVGITLVVLPLFVPRLRSRAYAITAATAVAAFAATALTWPLALWRTAPDALAAWWAAQLAPGFWAGVGGEAPFVAKNLLWFAWPVLPLAAWTLWMRGRGFNGGLRVAAVEIPLVLLLVMLVALLLHPEPRATLLMPLLVPLALLAAWEIDTLKRGYSAALDWFGILTFGLLAGLVWWVWIDAHLHGLAPRLARLFRDAEAGYRPEFQLLAFIVATFLTALWLALVRPARRSNRRAVLNWAVGMTLVWGLYMTIWLPYIDLRRSYRPVAEAIVAGLPAQGCVASRDLGEPMRALLYYYAGLATVREEQRPDHDCAYLVVQHGRLDAGAAAPEGWVAIHEGRRRGDESERYVLYRRRMP